MKQTPQEWRRAFHDDGFVIVEDLLDPALVSRLREGMDQITAGVESLRPQLKEKLFLERDHVQNNPQWYSGRLAPEDCGGAVRQITDLGLFGPRFAELIAYPPLLDVLETLFASPDFSFIQMVGRPKAARVGNGISNGNFHRDTPFADFTTAETMTALLSLDDMTASNGATSFITGAPGRRGTGRCCAWACAATRSRGGPSRGCAWTCSTALARRPNGACCAGSGWWSSSQTRNAALPDGTRGHRPFEEFSLAACRAPASSGCAVLKNGGHSAIPCPVVRHLSRRGPRRT
jgi:hypothetical protein